LRAFSRCMTFSMEDQCMVTLLLAQRQEAMYSQENLINFDHLRTNRSALGLKSMPFG
jgi:hypothetical protein